MQIDVGYFYFIKDSFFDIIDDSELMKNKENKVIKEKSKSDKKQVVSKIFAFIMLLLMVFASCSTCIYYVVATIQK